METRRRLRKRVKFCSWMKVYALPTRTTKKKKKARRYNKENFKRANIHGKFLEKIGKLQVLYN